MMIEFNGKGHHDLVDHPCVLPVGKLLFLDPQTGFMAIFWHVFGQSFAYGSRSRDVVDMRRRCKLLVCGASHSRVGQAVDRHKL